jgi:hypothetical protein
MHAAEACRRQRRETQARHAPHHQIVRTVSSATSPDATAERASRFRRSARASTNRYADATARATPTTALLIGVTRARSPRLRTEETVASTQSWSARRRAVARAIKSVRSIRARHATAARAASAFARRRPLRETGLNLVTSRATAARPTHRPAWWRHAMEARGPVTTARTRVD